jgi:hypothetical protein
VPPLPLARCGPPPSTPTLPKPRLPQLSTPHTKAPSTADEPPPWPSATAGRLLAWCHHHGPPQPRPSPSTGSPWPLLAFPQLSPSHRRRTSPESDQNQMLYSAFTGEGPDHNLKTYFQGSKWKSDMNSKIQTSELWKCIEIHRKS